MKTPRTQIVIVGAGLAGLSAACAIKRRLNGAADVTVIDKKADFIFAPSLIWVPFGWRTVDRLSVPIKHALARRGIEFVQAEVLRVDPADKSVMTAAGKTGYDYLLLATGPEPVTVSVPGLGAGYAQDISTPAGASAAAAAWDRFLREPGPVVVGALPGSGFLAAAYEFVFNLEYALRRRFLRHKAQITFATPEPHLGHLGSGAVPRARSMLEWYFRHADIDWAVNARVAAVTPGEILFKGGQLTFSYGDGTPPASLAGAALAYKYAMLLPPLTGSGLVRASGLGNERGFVVVDDCMRHRTHPEIFAAGACVALAAPTAAAVAAPRTGYISQVMAKTAADNIAAAVLGRAPKPRAASEYGLRAVIDAGDQGLVLLARHVYAPGLRGNSLLIPGWIAHWSKVLFERYFLWKARTGRLDWR